MIFQVEAAPLKLGLEQGRGDKEGRNPARTGCDLLGAQAWDKDLIGHPALQ